MSKLEVAPLRHYTECKSLKDVINKWVAMWLEPLPNIEAGKVELQLAILEVVRGTIPKRDSRNTQECKMIDSINSKIGGL